MIKPGTQIHKYIILRFERMKTDERIQAYLCYDIKFDTECYLTENSLKWIKRCTPIEYEGKQNEY